MFLRPPRCVPCSPFAFAGKNKTKTHFSQTLRQRVPGGLCVGALGLRYQPQRAGKPPALFSWIDASGVVSQRTPSQNKKRSGVPLLPSPPVNGDALSSLARPPSAWVPFAFCHFALFTSLRPQCFTAKIAASVSFDFFFTSTTAAICATRVQPVPV